MRYINGTVAIGSPHSPIRYVNAATSLKPSICADCFTDKPSQTDLRLICDGDDIRCANGQCYVCERVGQTIAQVEMA